MATRKRTTKRTAKKAAPKQSNSNIQAAQKSASQKRRQIEAAQARRDRGEQKPKSASLPAGMPVPKLEPRTSVPMANSGRGVDQDKIAQRDNGGDTFKGGPQAAQQIAGLASGIMKSRQEQQRLAAIEENKRNPNPLADASLYGQSNQRRADRLGALKYAQQNKQAMLLQKGGKAVWMGFRQNRVKIRNQGPERQDENGNTTTTTGVGDDVRSTDELMSWLSDEKTFNQIRDAAKKAGIEVQSYDDVAKLWEQVVKQAAATYSTTGKKVTPWALLSLRGKTMVNGRPAAKTTVSTSIEEMDPAQAKVMVKNSLQQMLGRDPRQDEIDDFISKAQTIAKQNPNVTTTTTQYGFDGSPVSQASVSRGGSDVVTAKAQLEAERLAENAPDYAQFQASGTYMPWMFEALASPV